MDVFVTNETADVNQRLIFSIIPLTGRRAYRDQMETQRVIAGCVLVTTTEISYSCHFHSASPMFVNWEPFWPFTKTVCPYAVTATFWNANSLLLRIIFILTGDGAKSISSSN